MLEGLRSRGFVDGVRRLQLRQDNPQGDIATANAIAKEVTSGNYDLDSLGVHCVASDHRQRKQIRSAAPEARLRYYIGSLGRGSGNQPRQNHAEHPPAT